MSKDLKRNLEKKSMISDKSNSYFEFSQKRICLRAGPKICRL